MNSSINSLTSPRHHHVANFYGQSEDAASRSVGESKSLGCTPQHQKLLPIVSSISSTLQTSSIFIDSLAQELQVLREKVIQQQAHIDFLNEKIVEKEAIEEGLRVREAEYERAFQNCNAMIVRLEEEVHYLKGTAMPQVVPEDPQRADLDKKLRHAEQRARRAEESLLLRQNELKSLEEELESAQRQLREIRDDAKELNQLKPEMNNNLAMASSSESTHFLSSSCITLEDLVKGINSRPTSPTSFGSRATSPSINDLRLNESDGDNSRFLHHQNHQNVGQTYEMSPQLQRHDNTGDLEIASPVSVNTTPPPAQLIQPQSTSSPRDRTPTSTKTFASNPLDSFIDGLFSL